MKIKNVTLILIIVLTACQPNNSLSDSLKKDLISFSATKNKALETGSLWVGFNKINAKKNNDTLIVDVNIELASTLC